MGALGLWVALALFMGIHSWQEGEEAAYQTGDRRQNLEGIEEQLARERNLRKAPHIILPELGDLPREHFTREYPERENTSLERPLSNSLLRADSSLERGGDSQDYTDTSNRNPPVYLGEDRYNPTYGAQSSSYLPADRRQIGNGPASTPLLPIDRGLENSTIPNSTIQNAKNGITENPILEKGTLRERSTIERSANLENRQKSNSYDSPSEDIRGSLQNRRLIEDVSTLPLPAQN